MDRGELVSDDVMIGIVRERLDAAGRARRVRPRRVSAHGGAGRGARRDDGRPRSADRRRHRGAGSGAGAAAGDAADLRARAAPTPDRSTAQVGRARARKCGGRLVQRADDNEAVVLERLKVYHAADASRWSSTTATRPTFRSINGAQPPDRGGARICAARDRGGAATAPTRRRSEPVIVCRSAAELERMREAGRLVGEVLTELAARVAPGVTTADLDALAEKRILRGRARRRRSRGITGIRRRFARRSTKR